MSGGSALRRAIMVKFAIIFTMVYFLITGTFTLVQIHHVYQQEKTRASAAFLNIEKLIRRQLTQTIVDNNLVHLEQLLNHFKDDPYLVGAMLQRYDKKRLLWFPDKKITTQTLVGSDEYQEFDIDNPQNVIARIVDNPVIHGFILVKKEGNGQNKQMGSAYLFSTRARLIENNKEQFVIMLLHLGIGTGVILIALFLLGWYYFHHPIRDLSKAINRVIKGEARNVSLHEHTRSKSDVDHLVSLLHAMIEKVTQAQDSLTKNRLHLSLIIDAMPSILIGVTRSGDITDWNAQAESFSCIARSDAIGMHYTKASPVLSNYTSLIDKAMRSGKPQKMSNLQLVPLGEQRYFDLVVYPLLQEGINGVVIRLDDVTAQMQIEEMIVQTEKMTTVGRLAAGMAHEVNNPLGTIIQNVQNVIRRLDVSNQKNQQEAKAIDFDLEKLDAYLKRRNIIKFVNAIQESGQRAAKIVENLLRFSRRSNSSLVITNLEDVIEKSIDLVATEGDLKNQLDFKNVGVVRDFIPNLPQIMCEPTEIQQVIINLIKNAAQAMMGAQMTAAKVITIRTRVEDSNIRLEIEDNGPGMEESVRKKIFEPFFTTKDIGKGTGLGLSVCYHIITESHSGSIAVESALNLGTKFIILLPFVR